MAARLPQSPEKALLKAAAEWQPTNYTSRRTKYSPFLPAVQMIVRNNPRVSIVEIVDGFILPQLPGGQRPVRRSAGWWRWYHFTRRAAHATGCWTGGRDGTALTEP